MEQAWQGNVRCCVPTPQHMPKIQFRSAVIRHHEHKYRALHFWAKMFLNNS